MATVGIIGVGSIGLCATRWCLERGFQPTAFERSDTVGGVWRTNYDSLYTNSSRTLMNLSDFPFPFETSSAFPSRAEICRYYTEYMKHHALDQYIHFNTTVKSVVKSGEKWVVETDKAVHEFDKILICTGKFWDKKLPDWAWKLTPGSIHLAHSCEYKNSGLYKGKNVLIVGIGNSALDISLELARDPEVKSITISCRNGAIILPTKDDADVPNDGKLATRFYQYWLPSSMRGLYFAKMVQSVNKQMRKFGVPAPREGDLSPAARISNLKETKQFLEQLRSKRIKIKPGVREIHEDEHKVTLSDGETLDVDAIVCCTGYRTNMDYLDEMYRNKIIQNIEFSNPDGSKRELEWMRLFKGVMYPEDPSLCALGMITSLGNETCIGEMQARWVTSMWKSEQYNLQERIAGCDSKRRLIEGLKPSVSMFVRYVPYMDNLAKDIKVDPKTNITDTKLDLPLYYALNFKPVVPAQFRLDGDDHIAEARDVLVSKL